MTAFEPFGTATALAQAIRARKLSAREALDAQLARIAAHNPQLNAIVTLDAEGARARAQALDDAQARGQPLAPLHGVPFTLKDAFATAGLRTTVGHPPLAEYVPDHDATVAARLRAAGGVLLGKTNVPPLLFSAQTDNPIFGRTNNPWDLGRTVGGSSGGSGAAVAAGLCAFDIGSDLSGSIRIPANYCGVFGFKPSGNRVPGTGHIPPLPGTPRVDRFMASYGPLARSVADLALVTGLLVGPDGQDMEVPPVPWCPAEPRSPRSLRIAYLPTFPGVPTAAEVRDTTVRVATELERAGAHVEERGPGFAIDALNEVWRAFFALLLPSMQALMAGPTSAPAGSEGAAPALSLLDWLQLLERRDALLRATDALLGEFDAFLSPAGISTAFPHGPPRSPIPVDGAPVESRFVDHYLYPFSFTGHPAVVLPAGLGAGGLPIGVQLVGRRFGDEALLAVAATVDEVLGAYRPPPQFS